VSPVSADRRFNSRGMLRIRHNGIIACCGEYVEAPLGSQYGIVERHFFWIANNDQKTWQVCSASIQDADPE
jgi:hypothetical protein